MNKESIVAALANDGWCVVPGFLGEIETAAIRAECLRAHAAGAFHAAGTGRGQAQVRSEVRGDQVLWLDEANTGPALLEVLDRFESLRQAVNQKLFLGLFDLETHFAVYSPGGGYQRHLDRFRDDDRRSLTVILYPRFLSLTRPSVRFPSHLARCAQLPMRAAGRGPQGGATQLDGSKTVQSGA